MKKARITTLVLCIVSAAIISGFINIMSGIAFLITDYSNSVNDYTSCGTHLLISSVLLIAAVVIAAFERVWIPALFNIIGSYCYIYTVVTMYSIPNTEIPKTVTERLAERNLYTVIVTVLLAILIFLNYFSEKNTEKRNKKRRDKHDRENRKLTDSEKIV